MNSPELVADRLRLKLRMTSDHELWRLFLHHRVECTREFWEELEKRKAAGSLSKNSPFWTIRDLGKHFQTRRPDHHSNLIEPTRDEWEAHRRRKMFRVISA